MPTATIYTLGCKVNQAESAMLAEEFSRRGYELVPWGGPADVVVINTCTVTQRTDACSRQAIRRALREWPRAFVAVVGCYAQLAAERLAAIPGVDAVLGADAKFLLFDYLDGGQKRRRPAVRTAEPRRQFVAPCPGDPTPRTRAFLKVQDGCNGGCSFCTVPLARGPARSATVEDVLVRAAELASRGHKELVLTGVHMGLYGQDLGPGIDLAALLQLLCAELPDVRFRLSSLECPEVTPRLVQVIAEHPPICRHFHIPLQSGSDAILSSMRRPYTAQEFMACVASLRAAFPEASIGTDVIVGYPGETESDFRATLDLLNATDVTYLHVFRYSKRANTLAAELAGEVPAELKEARAAALRRLGNKKRVAFAGRFVGTRLWVLFERQAEGYALGLSDNYLRVRVPTANRHTRNLVALVQIEQMSEDGYLVGHIAATPSLDQTARLCNGDAGTPRVSACA
ncbi:MAG: tRNA (N(6)-L-threonylcarbamoyladenosine(37)-C(2))-methylthiotransferase MtaB [Candidatus Oleimicrobiaceae bacterium]